MNSINYMPYLSDEEEELEESDLESSDDESIGQIEDTVEARRATDPRFALLRAPTQQLAHTVDDRYGEWDPTTVIQTNEDHVYLDPPKTTKTSLVCIKSINRDKNVYPSPYRFQLKLPRVYKHVTKFQLVQLSFPNGNSQNLSQAALLTSSIVKNLIQQGIPSSCISDCVSLLNCSSGLTTSGLVEQGRLTAAGEPLLVSLSIPDGTYTEPQMARELTFRANSTPPFNLISYEMFREVFMTTRDISVLFNEPSDGYYSAITHRKYGSHTKQDIMGAYYTPSHLDSFPVITERIAFNAYYYPILKEMMATQRAEPFLQSDIPYDIVFQRVIGIFEGLDSEFYYQLGRRNQGTLNVYRRSYTFQYRNINKYICSYNEQQRQCTMVHDTLHPSLLKDLSLRQQYLLDQRLSLSELDSFSFTRLKQDVGKCAALVRHMETNLSTVLAGYHLMSGMEYRGGDIYYGDRAAGDGAGIGDRAGGDGAGIGDRGAGIGDRGAGIGDEVRDRAGAGIGAGELDADIEFTTMFRYTSSFGGIYGNYQGTVYHFSSFGGYHSTLSSHYQLLQSTQCAISCIHGDVYHRMHDYVSTKYTGVLPQTMIDQRTYLVPNGIPVSLVPGRSVYIPGESVLDAERSFSVSYLDIDCKALCCSTLRGFIGAWYSCLPTNFITQTMSYRLGLINTTPSRFNFLSTIMDITSTGNLNLYMNINDEQGFNNMDVTMPENYNVSNETTGQVKLMCAKILMGALGDTGISQTVIQNPSLFENGLGKLDQLDIKIYYDDQNITPAWIYQPYNLDFLEWNATFQIDEEVGFANRATGWGTKPTIPVPKNPDHTPYIFFTHKNNPNNS